GDRRPVGRSRENDDGLNETFTRLGLLSTLYSPLSTRKNMAKLLVVDDERNLRLVVQKEMTRQGHDVETADDGEAAWALLEEQDFDVLLCDINMPRLDGMGLLRRTRERCQNPPEFIMLTGQATVESAIEAMKLGAYDYLTKPYRISELSALVTAAADKQQIKTDN